MIYPQGTKFPQRWNLSPTWGSGSVDDVQFYRDVLDDLSAIAFVVISLDRLTKGNAN